MTSTLSVLPGRSAAVILEARQWSMLRVSALSPLMPTACGNHLSEPALT